MAYRAVNDCTGYGTAPACVWARDVATMNVRIQDKVKDFPLELNIINRILA